MRIKKHNQSGLVSIMVAAVLMILMSLITLGFTRVVQNEQRQALDNQLSRQAFFAAESGINIASSDPSFPEKRESCDVAKYNNGEIDPNTPEVVFTCILINPTPEDLVFNNDSISSNKSKVVPLKTSSAARTVTFQWNDSSSTKVENNCEGVLNLATNPNTWDKISAFKVDLIGIPREPFTRQNLIDNQFSAIFYPCVNNPSRENVVFASASGNDDIGRIIPVNCEQNNANEQYRCRVNITSIPNTYREIYARFNAVYGSLNVRITASDVGGNTLLFSGSQAVIDSTGKANDVFRRLQARVPLYNNYFLPTAGIQTVNDVCKLYRVLATEVQDGCSP
jgi:Tfp pilus assembly protein PilX